VLGKLSAVDGVFNFWLHGMGKKHFRARVSFNVGGRIMCGILSILNHIKARQ
jgi:hypothetical protein